MEPTVSGARGALDRAIEEQGLTGSWWTQVTEGRLLLLSGGGASEGLKAAVRSRGVMFFLQTMARGGSVGEVSAAAFSEERAPGPHSWYYRVPGKGLENSKYVKSRFRGEGQGRRGKHEWIPCAKIIDIVSEAHRENEAERGAQWLSLQDRLRSPTGDLVFRPADAPSLVAKVGAYVTEAEGDFDVLDAKLKETETKLDDYAIGGHIGALYLESDGKRSPQVDRSDAFHKRLNELFDFHQKNPTTYGAELAKEVKSNGSAAALWDGDVKGILPVEFNTEPYAKLVPSHYQDKTGASWGEHLWAFQGAVRKKQRAVVESLEETQP